MSTLSAIVAERPTPLCGDSRRQTRPSPSMDLDRALAFSRYAQRTLAAQPALADWLVAHLDAPFDWDAPRQDIAVAADSGDAAALARTLRQWRHS